MSIVVLENAKVWLGGFDISGALNSVAIEVAAESLDATVFGNDGWRSTVAGLKSINAGMSGFTDPAYDETILGALSTSSVPFSAAMLGATAGNQAYCFNARIGNYQRFNASVGDIMKFEANAFASSDRLARGLLLHSGSVTSDGSGTAFELGAVSASQKLCASLHITAFDATSIAVTLSSSATEGGSYTTRGTFTTATAVGGTWLTPVSGAITDTWWKANWDITGTSATIAVIAGIA